MSARKEFGAGGYGQMVTGGRGVGEGDEPWTCRGLAVNGVNQRFPNIPKYCL